ncbi:MAG: aminotransferase class III-fold pyridoxal phosphate-dependent enzyme [Anaerolineae bacterium]
MTTLLQSIEIEDQHTSGGYSKRPLTIVRGEGSTVYDDAGNAYLDLTSGMGVALLGHAHPAVAVAIAAQASTLITLPEIFYSDRRAKLYASSAKSCPATCIAISCATAARKAIEGALKVRGC